MEPGQTKSLLRKLDQIRKHVGRERYRNALNVLDAFVNQVESFREEDIPTDGQANLLLAQARSLETAIDQLAEPTENAVKASQRAGESVKLPTEFSLAPAYPNPFNSRTIIPYALPEAVHVRMEIFDALGRTVAVLIDREQEAGHYAVAFNEGAWRAASTCTS